MLEMEINPATIIVGLVIIALVTFALYRLRTKGLCDCKECGNEEGSCAGCNAVDKMLSAMEKAAKAGQ